jgi:hypothetical protein
MPGGADGLQPHKHGVADRICSNAGRVASAAAEFADPSGSHTGTSNDAVATTRNQSVGGAGKEARKAKEDALSVERLRELLDYDPETKVRSNRRLLAGDIAGTLRDDGYWRIYINKQSICHIAWRGFLFMALGRKKSATSTCGETTIDSARCRRRSGGNSGWCNLRLVQ